MVGDPDQPTGNLIAIYGYWFVVFRVPTSWMNSVAPFPQTLVRLNRKSNAVSRAGHAR
jgi:hypothetical protein